MTRVLAFILLSVSVLSACGPLPRPFGRDAGDSGSKLARGIFFEGVEVQPLSGTTLPMGKLIAGAVIEKLQKAYEIPAAYEGLDRSEYVLTGHVIDRATGSSGDAQISIEWGLLRRDGEVIGKFEEDVGASRLEWDYGSAPLLIRIGDDIGTRVAKLVLGERFGTAGQDRLLGRSGLLIGTVSGAPGDGDQSLRRAMAVALGGGGVRLTNKPDEAMFTLNGVVAMGAPDQGAQSVRIEWLIKDVNGKVVGRAEQTNVVGAGSLDGRWGRTAAFVAAAAMPGIITVVERNDTSRLRGPDLGAPRAPRVIPGSNVQPPPLQQVPGRAPPPPK